MLAEAATDSSIALGDVTICTQNACYRPHTVSTVEIHNTSSGTATQIADGIVPLGTYTHVHFSDRAGKKIVNGTVQLRTPLKLETGFQGGEILVAVSRKTEPDRINFVPSVAVGALMDPSSESVYYHPNFHMNAKLRLGAELSIPAGALSEPQIFSVSVRDIGSKHPAIDIFPYLALAKPASLRTSAIRSAPNSDPGAEAASSRVDAVISSGKAAVSEEKALRTFQKTGFFKKSATNVTSPTMAPPPGPLDGPPLPCLDQLNDPAYMNYIRSLLPQTGVVRIMACENSPPYVHIAMINTYDPRINPMIPYQLAGARLVLRRLTDLTAGSNAIINGFKWSGDYGYSPGQTGLALGYVSSDTQLLGTNLVGGGVEYFTGPFDGNKLVLSYMKQGPYSRDKQSVSLETSDWFTNMNIDTRMVVSSSTSVIKQNNCTTDSLQDRWSAIGARDGITILMSSTSDSSTTAAALCPVFRMFGIDNALRLDGGPSTAIAIGGILLNPLVGFDRLKYGETRFIAYPIKFGG